MSEPNFNARLEKAALALHDIINELGDGYAPTLAKQNIEIATRVARDFNANPPRTVTATAD